MDDTLEIIENLNNKLKLIQTWEEFEVFQKEMESYELGLILKGKRRNFYANHFTHMHKDKLKNDEYASYAQTSKFLNRVRYLYSDSKSKGESYVKNLHRVLIVSQ